MSATKTKEEKGPNMPALLEELENARAHVTETEEAAEAAKVQLDDVSRKVREAIGEIQQLAGLNGTPTTRKRNVSADRMPFEEREKIHVARVKKSRGKPVAMIDIRKNYADHVGKDVKVVAAQVKGDCEKSDLLTVKGKGRKMTVVAK